LFYPATKDRKLFCFEKKNQETFTRFGKRQNYRRRQQKDKSFLVLFFKKELLASFLA